MNPSWKLCLAALAVTLLQGPTARAADLTDDAAKPHIIPCPKSLTPGSGQMQITSASRIVAVDAELQPLTEVLAGEIYRIGGVRLATGQGKAGAGDIVLQMDLSLHGEQYTFAVNDQAVCRGGTYVALAWSTATLLQALVIEATRVALPKLAIKDEPDFAFRSAMTDIARKWHPLANLHELVELFRFYKIRYLQLHMNDHGMFTFGSKLFPQLATVGKNGRRHYTIEELKELVAYADARGVTLIPEIEMPGHSDAGGLLPEIFGTKDPTTGKYRSAGMVNITRDDTIDACGRLLDEVMDVFTSSPYVSIGADEVARPAIAKIAEYEAFCSKHDLKGVGEVYDNFIARMNDVANRHHKSLMTYGQGGPKNVVQMPWVGNDDTFTKAGYPTVRYQGGSVTQHMVTFCGPPYNTIMLYSSFTEKIYNADYRMFKGGPLPGPENVLGAHILSWQNWHFVTFRDFRRTMAVVAENVWNHDHKESRKPWDEWKKTWQAADASLDDLVFPVKIEADGLLSPDDIVFHQSLTLRLRSTRTGTIRYRMEDLDYFNPPALPDAGSPVYQEPLVLTKPTVIYAALFDQDGHRIGHGTERRYFPITPMLICRAYDDPAIREAADRLLTADDGTRRLYPDYAALGLKPSLTFPLGRLTFQPSHEGVYFTSTYLVMEGRISIPAAGAYQFWADGNAEILVDGKPVARGAPPQTKKKGPVAAAATAPSELHLDPGEHRLTVLTGPGNKGQSVARYQGPGMSSPKPLDDLILQLPK